MRPLCERVAQRLKQAGLAAGTVTLKLKTADFRLRTRSRSLADPTPLAEILFERLQLPVLKRTGTSKAPSTSSATKRRL